MYIYIYIYTQIQIVIVTVILHSITIILLTIGLEGSSSGVSTLHAHCATYIRNEEVSRLVIEIKKKLGAG